MPSERVQRQIDTLLDHAEAALTAHDWDKASDLCRRVLAIDPQSPDARAFLEMAGAGEAAGSADGAAAPEPPGPMSDRDAPRKGLPPESFASGRYVVRAFLGQGASKKVYLAHDTRLDREVALAVVEGLDGDSLERVRREARAVARLGDHPNIVAVYDTLEETGRLLTVYQYMAGGSFAELIDRGAVPFERIVSLGAQVCEAIAFAHGKGVIHRDLKPANVFLSETGEAKLGDFGLAAALDRTRLTEQGTFLGTAAYMAPEQALGQPAGPQSDLYALGCVLYELMTGRPPFVGDDTVAVVTQHLNTPPVAPSWHRADVPPGLEALVLRLLEKDPAGRPASAAEVGTALRAIDSAPTPAPHSSRQATTAHAVGPDPLYRTTFVGRERELRQLQSALDAAFSGSGGLVMVVGEPGIGKTAVTEQLATYAAIRGARTLHGSCYEEGSLSLSYLPFIEALRSYVLDRDPEGLRSELGSNAPFVARIVSEVRDRLSVELPPAGDPEDDRWRLLQSVTGFLRSASAVQPLMVVLEDLHWADRGTLDLLTHLSRNLDGARLLVVGTYRDVEVDRSHPLANALADLRRITAFTRIPLRGLSATDVRTMLTNLAGHEVAWTVAEQIHRETEGNPLFVQEVVRYLVEEGLLAREAEGDGRAGNALALHIPEGLRDVIGRRLSRLSPETNRLLAVAAVVGREFRLDILQDVAGLTEDEVYAALEEATGKGVLEEHRQGGVLGYRFTHAFLRQTLYEEIFTPRRIRTHQQVARTMERTYGNRVEEHAAELAEHFAQSTDAEDLGKAVQYGEVAAQRAMRVSAYMEAARHLEAALQAQEVLDSDDLGKRCDLQVSLMEALLPAGESERLLEDVAPRAFALAEQLDDDARRGAVSRLAVDAAGRQLGGPAFGSGRGSLWLERARQFTPADHLDRLGVDIRIAIASGEESDYHGRWVELTRIYRAAVASGRPEAIYLAAGLGPLNVNVSPPDLGFVRSVLEETDRVPSAGVSGRALGVYYMQGTRLWLALGNRNESDRHQRLLADLVSRTPDQYVRDQLGVAKVAGDFVDGRLDEVASFPLETLQSLIARSVAAASVGRAMVYRGRAGEASQLWRTLGPLTQGSVIVSLIEAYYLAISGGSDDARAALQPFLDAAPLGAHLPLTHLVRVLEVAVLGQDAELTERLLPLVMPAVDAPATHHCVNSVGRIVGQAEESLGRFEDAKDHYLRALAATRSIRFRPEAAICAYHLAKLLSEHFPGERPDAPGLLDECIPEFREMGMPVYLEDALRLKLRLQGIEDADPSSSIVAVSATVQIERPDVSTDVAPDGTVTLMFTDIENSTALTEQLGDAKWVQALRVHNAVVEEQTKAHGGRVVKNRGDGYMLVFALPERGLACALAIQRALAGDEVIRVRIGLHTGNPKREGEDFFGTDVNLAARVADRAVGGQVLVSERTRGLLAQGGRSDFGEPVEVELKGLSGRHRLFEVRSA